MKTLLIVGVASVFSSSAWADEPAAAPPAPEVKAEATEVMAPDVRESVPEAVQPIVLGGFCGQAMVQQWLWRTDVGRELRLRQQAEAAQALTNRGPGAWKQRSTGAVSPAAVVPTPEAAPEVAKAQAAKAEAK